MSNEESPPSTRLVFPFRDPVAIKLGDTDPAAGSSAPRLGRVDVKRRKRSLIARASDQEWASSALLLLLDIVAWFLIYGFTNVLRGETHYSFPFVFVIVDVLQISVIVTTLFTIGGYERNT